MPFSPTAFQRLLEPIDRRILNGFVDKHKGNHGVGNGSEAWTCQRHLKTLLFAQIAGLDSLREIEQALAAKPAALYHLGLRVPKRSTLSDASANRPVAVFRDLCQHLIGIMGRKVRKESNELIQLLDASPIPLKESHFTWPERISRTRGLKIYVHLDLKNKCPIHFAITSPKVSDTTLAAQIKIECNQTYIFDKGFTDYNWWDRIERANSVFITRLKKNARQRDIEEKVIQEGGPVLAERTFKIGHKIPRGGVVNSLYNTPLREIVVEREGKDPMSLVTNDHKRSAEEIAELYRQRWQIELFFKWIKQNLKIKKYLGRSENAVKMQIYVAIIAFLLLRFLKNTYAKAFSGTEKLLISRLKVSLLDPINFQNRSKPPPISPFLKHAKTQLELGELW